MPSLIMWAAILFDVGFAIFHVMFWYLFGWPARLNVSGGINTAITQTLNAMLIVFGLYAAALLWHATASERAPAMLLLAGAGFWLVRAAAQPVLFRIGRGTSAAFVVTFLTERRCTVGQRWLERPEPWSIPMRRANASL